MRCPFCGSSLEHGAKYCNECGTAVDSECKGKNINYRSYTDTKPNASVNIPNPVPKPTVNPQRENPFVDKNAQYRKPPVSNLPSAAYSMSNVNTKKKSGCGTIAIIITVLIMISGVVSAIMSAVDETDDFDISFDNGYIEQYNDEFEKDSDLITDEMLGRVDGKYYLNDYVNFAFVLPEGFEDVTDSLNWTDMKMFASDDDSIFVMYDLSDDVDEFLDNYTASVYESLTDSELFDGSNAYVGETVKKQVGDRMFFGKTVYCGDIEGECQIHDVYATEVDGKIFFIDIFTSSPEINGQIINSFVNSYANG